MPLLRGRDSQGNFYQFGKSGHKYRYATPTGRVKARALAALQGRAIEFRKHGGGRQGLVNGAFDGRPTKPAFKLPPGAQDTLKKFEQARKLVTPPVPEVGGSRPRDSRGRFIKSKGK